MGWGRRGEQRFHREPVSCSFLRYRQSSIETSKAAGWHVAYMSAYKWIAWSKRLPLQYNLQTSSLCTRTAPFILINLACIVRHPIQQDEPLHWQSFPSVNVHICFATLAHLGRRELNVIRKLPQPKALANVELYTRPDFTRDASNPFPRNPVCCV